MLVSRPMTSGTPCFAATAARYFLLMSPNGCSTKLTLTPGCVCSNSGTTVSIETLSKYHTVRTLSTAGASAIFGGASAFGVSAIELPGGAGVAGGGADTAGPQALASSAAP